MRQNYRQIKNPKAETRVFNSRIFASVIIVSIALMIIFSRFFYLQVIKHKELLQSSEKNRIRTTSLSPARGFIYDRNGVLLVDNIPTYRLHVIPEKSGNLKEKLYEMQSLVNLTDNEIDDILEKEKQNPPFKPIIVKAKLSEEELSNYASRKYMFPAFTAIPYLIRHYRYTDLIAHLVGYVGRINESDADSLDKKRYQGTEYTGKQGLEKSLEDRLHGQPGQLTIETNARGRVLRTIKEELPVSGEDIQLTIDIRLQQAAFNALGDMTGSIIVANPNNGEILAMVSKPGFDPNDFVNGISQKKYSLLLNSIENPLFNRSIKGGYEPGSTIKPYMALAGLYYGIITPDFKMLSKGYFQLPNQPRKYHDWMKGGHGWVGIEESIAQSVNTFYYSLAPKIGIDRIHSFLANFNFGKTANIELNGENSGLLPSREWKKETKGMIWFPGETVITGIGQGFLLNTPIQLTNALAILANKGKSVQLHLVKNNTSQNKKFELNIEEKYWEIVHKGMIDTIHHPKGSAHAIANKNYLIAGKSGTSQVYGKSEEEIYVRDTDIPKHLRNHALFIAFAPADKPEIVVVVVAEHGASGSKVAAPIAGEVIEQYLLKIKPQGVVDAGE